MYAGATKPMIPRLTDYIEPAIVDFVVVFICHSNRRTASTGTVTDGEVLYCYT